MLTYFEEQAIQNDLSMMLHSERLGNSPNSEAVLLQVLWMNGFTHYYELLHGPVCVSSSQRFLWQLLGVDPDSEDEVYDYLLRAAPEMLNRFDRQFFAKTKKHANNRLIPCFENERAKHEKTRQNNHILKDSHLENKPKSLKLAGDLKQKEDNNHPLCFKFNFCKMGLQVAKTAIEFELKPKPKKRRKHRR